MQTVQDRYDVVILGGAFSGASAAILLRREHPSLRVLIVEKAERFDETVGEATDVVCAGAEGTTRGVSRPPPHATCAP